ncbi:MAG TPA: YbaK/EbsC family protein [Syntrophales bacterium]|nr:YbaK/EbsC family protein [Syntrophales bacterium]
MVTPCEAEEVFRRLVAILSRGNVPFVVHQHEPTRTIEEAERNLSFAVERIVKTVAFRARGGGIILAALRGTRRVDYPRLAALIGVTRRDISSLSPMEVKETIGVEPGSVSPLMPVDSAILIIDRDVLSIAPTLYCGSGRPDRTLEMAPEDLARLTGARIACFSK